MDGAKMKRRSFLAAAVLGMVLLTGGCGKETPKSLLAKTVDNMSSLDSYSMNMLMNLDASGSVMGINLDMGMNLDLDMDVTVDPQRVHGTGQVSMEVLNQSQNMDMEMYVLPEGEKVVSYVGTDGTWIKEETKNVRGTLKAYEFQSLGSLVDSLELSEKTVEEEGKECYVLSGKVNEKILEDMLGMVMDSIDTEDLELDGENLENAQLDFKLYIEKNKKYPVKMVIDLQSLMEAALRVGGGLDMDVSCESCEFVCIFNGFNAVDKIELPAKVKESAVHADESR